MGPSILRSLLIVATPYSISIGGFLVGLFEDRLGLKAKDDDSVSFLCICILIFNFCWVFLSIFFEGRLGLEDDDAEAEDSVSFWCISLFPLKIQQSPNPPKLWFLGISRYKFKLCYSVIWGWKTMMRRQKIACLSGV